VAGRIPQTFIDDLLNRVDIVDIVDNEVPLKKSGRDYQALCPFHNEKSPSFTVSQEKQFYHCFGCGAHGSVLGFLMDHRGLSFVEAVEEAARSVGLEVPSDGAPAVPKADHSPLYETLVQAQQFFVRQLKKHPDRDRAVNYLKSRGVSGEIAKRFGIGFAPDSWDALMKAHGADDRALQNLHKAGLVIAKDTDKHYDRFRDRVTFPIYDRRGRVVAFGGRIIDKGEPKYLNSPETAVFRKRRELYGLYQVRQFDSKVERIVVVEGYMDVVALAQYGVNNSVATLGTATTSEQLEMLFKTAPQVTFCFDGDPAGRRAAWRALETTLPLIRDGRQAGFLFIPEGHDPDSLVRETGPEFFSKTEAIKPLSEFLLDEIAAKTNLGSIDGRARFVDLAKPLVTKIPPGSFRQLLIQKIAEITLLDPAVLSDSYNGKRRSPAPPRRPRRRGRPSTLNRALKRLLFDPKLAAYVLDTQSIAALPEENATLLADIVEFSQAHPEITTGGLVERYRGTDHEAFVSEQLESPPELDKEAESVEFRLAIDSLLQKASRPSALARAEAEMRRRAEDA
jgi:DNA primase